MYTYVIFNYTAFLFLAMYVYTLLGYTYIIAS